MAVSEGATILRAHDGTHVGEVMFLKLDGSLAARVYVRMNMNRLRRLLRRRTRRLRARQLEFNLWPKDQKHSGRLWKKYVTPRSRS